MARVVLRVRYEDLRLAQWATEAPNRARRVMQRFIPKAGAEGVRTMREVMGERFNRLGVRAPGMTTTRGLTRASVRATLGPRRAYVDIGPNTPYAAYVDEGTKPHFIFPRSALALRFKRSPVGPRGPVKVTRGNKWVYAKRVLHPGFQGHRFTGRTRTRLKPRLRVLLRSVVNEELSRGGP